MDEYLLDLDGDGYTEAEGDCDDGIFCKGPAPTEVCDGLDNDCDGDVDEGCAAALEPVPEPAGSSAAVPGAPGGGAWLVVVLAGLGRRRAA